MSLPMHAWAADKYSPSSIDSLVDVGIYRKKRGTKGWWRYVVTIWFLIIFCDFCHDRVLSKSDGLRHRRGLGNHSRGIHRW